MVAVLSGSLVNIAKEACGTVEDASQPSWNELISPRSRILVPERHANVSECLEQGATTWETAAEQLFQRCPQCADPGNLQFSGQDAPEHLLRATEIDGAAQLWL